VVVHSSQIFIDPAIPTAIECIYIWVDKVLRSSRKGASCSICCVTSDKKEVMLYLHTKEKTIRQRAVVVIVIFSKKP